MSLRALQKGGLEVTLAGALAIILAGFPVGLAEPADLTQPASTSAVVFEPAAMREVEHNLLATVFPGCGAMAAGAIVFVPFGLSMLRIRRGSRSA